MANPYDQVYDELWTILEANGNFTDLVTSGNRIKYDNRDPEKDGAMYADYPWVQLKEANAGHGESQAAHLFRTSNMSTFLKQYYFQIATGEQEQTSVHAVEFEIIRALADWPTFLTKLAWSETGEKFVKELNLLGASEMLDNQEMNRGIRGWSTVWACSVLFAFQTTALQPS